MVNLLFAGDFIPTPDVKIDTELKNQIENADYSFINLETPLTNSDRPIKKTGNNFKAASELVTKIREFGFNGVTLANNHIRDFGDQGVLDTIQSVVNENLLYVGAEKDIKSAKKPLQLKKKVFLFQ